MHRATPQQSSLRAYTSGGCRSVVSKVDDTKLMQECNDTHGMKNEEFPVFEAPQNYGFTSVVADATKLADGKLFGAEAFIQFMGGNRSFPVASVMDDRRHRLKGLDKGDTAIFGLKEWGEQFHINKLGMWLVGNVDKKISLRLVQNSNEQQQQQQQGSTQQSASAGNTGTSGAGQQQQQKATGQDKLYDKDTETEIEITKDKIVIKRGKGHVQVTDTAVIAYFNSEENSFRVDQNHTHIRFGENRIWVDAGGCWTTKDIVQKDDPND